MHKKGFAHRDIKPENVFLDENCVPKLGDFGLAKKYKLGDKLTTCCGTDTFQAPEIENSESGYLAMPVDVFSLGVTLYVMVTSKYPFEQTDDMLHKMLYQDPVAFK